MLTFKNEEIKWVSLPILSKCTPGQAQLEVHMQFHLQITAQEEKRRLEQIRTPPFTPYYHNGPIQSPESEYHSTGKSHHLSQRESSVGIRWVGVMPGSLDEELMRDDPLILLNVRKNLLLGATHYLQLKKSLSVTLHLTTQGCLLDRTGYTGETWKPSPKVVLQP